jgi:hypothetical protein
VRGAPFCCEDQRAVGPGRIMPNVLIVPTVEFSDPIAVLVLGKCSDLARGHSDREGLPLYL